MLAALVLAVSTGSRCLTPRQAAGAAWRLPLPHRVFARVEGEDCRAQQGHALAALGEAPGVLWFGFPCTVLYLFTEMVLTLPGSVLSALYVFASLHAGFMS